MKRKLYEKIDDYLNGNMDEQAAIRFEQELKSDPALAKEFRIMLGIKEMLKRLEFIEIVKQARENYYEEKQKAKNSKTEV